MHAVHKQSNHWLNVFWILPKYQASPHNNGDSNQRNRRADQIETVGLPAIEDHAPQDREIIKGAGVRHKWARIPSDEITILA